MRTAMIGTDAVRHLLSAEQARRLDDGALGMHPFGLNRVEPGILDGQKAGHDTYPLALLLDLLVVQPDPRPHGLAHLLGRVVPDQRPHRDAPRQSRNGRVIALRGQPVTKRSQTSSCRLVRRSKRP
jgi:hypothetical protein